MVYHDGNGPEDNEIPDTRRLEVQPDNNHEPVEQPVVYDEIDREHYQDGGGDA